VRLRSLALLLIALPALLLLAKEARAQPPLLVRGPYLQLGTSTSVVVRWRTSAPNDSRVRFGSSPGALVHSAGDAAAKTEHEVRLASLSPETRYYYSVGTSTLTLAGGDAEHFFVTAPPPGAPRPVRIWAFGDVGLANAPQIPVRDAYLRFAGGRHADVWLMLGDNAYVEATDGDYQTDFFGIYPMVLRQTVVWPTFGNHEAMSSDPQAGTGPYFDIFTLPAAGEAGGVPSGTEAYYSFDYANIHFVGLNSELADLSPGGPMLTWLRADLAASAREWTIVFFHSPPYTKGSHDSDAEEPLITMRENALPLLEQMGVDLVLCGHSHAYERSYFLDGHYGSSDTFEPVTMRLEEGDGAAEGDGPYRKIDDPTSDAHAGTVYAVVGTGELNQGLTNLAVHPAMVRSIDDRAGTLVVDVEGKRLDALFLDDRGTVQDRFTIEKTENLPPVAVDDRATTERDTSVVIPVLANDRDGNGDRLALRAVTDPGHGTAVANPDGTVTYTPDPGFAGTDSFRYKAVDGRGGTGRATVEVAVLCPPLLGAGFADDLEPAAEPGWRIDTAVNAEPASPAWSAVPDLGAHSPQHSWFSDASPLATAKDDRLVAPLQDLAAGSRLAFWHRFQLEPGFDGGVLEISADGGVRWTDLGPYILANGYTGTLAAANPLGARGAWTGASPGGEMVRVEVDLSAFAGPGRLVRWRLGCDSITADAATGWFVDDVEFTGVVVGREACTPGG
jgi:Big-like domain-containing protein/calcineurin-like phosphoesterase family protein/purple acid phosphatase-like protein